MRSLRFWGWLPVLLLCLQPAAASEVPYTLAHPLDLVHLLPPPPRSGSPEEAADLQAVLDAQAVRTPDQAARVAHDDVISVFLFSTVLGAQFSPETLPVTARFFKRVSKTGASIVDPTKQVWLRTRPYDLSAKVHPAVPPIKGSGAYSYPSGHAAFAYQSAAILSWMVPEKRQEIYERAAQLAENRIIAGVHYPSDRDGGEVAGIVIAAALRESPEFLHDLQVSRTELRQALRLPANDNEPRPVETEPASRPAS